MSAPIAPAEAARLKALPKAEVHLHLEGCFEAALIAQWAKSEGVALPRPQEDLFKFSGLADFLGFLDLACGLARTQDRLVELSYGLSQRLAANGTGYADVIFNPTHWHAWHGRLGPMLDAIHAGFSAAEQDGLPGVGLCVSLLRTQSANEAIELVDTLITLRHPRVVALSVDGNEATAGRTGPRFADAFRKAGSAGLRRTVHAGESSGADGVRDAVELLGADRIDHGVRAIEDPAVVALDQDGRHVVSLLSGHLGGANELARRVAQVTGGTANLMRRNSSSEAWALVDSITNRAVVVSNPVTGAQYQFTAVSPSPVVRADQ